MNDAERRLRELGEDARRDVAHDLVPERRALRRIRFRRRALSATAAGTVVMVVLGGVVVAGGGTDRAPDTPPAKEGSVTPSPERGEGSRACGFPFEPTYLPQGFDARARAGSASDGGASGEIASRRHYLGDPGRVIEVGVRPPAPFRQTNRARIHVLGRRATIGAIHEGYSVEFRAGRCRYEMLGYGITRAQLRGVAEGLRPEVVDGELAALWPEDTSAAALAACAGDEGWRRSRSEVARRFVAEVLAWEGASLSRIVAGPPHGFDVTPPEDVRPQVQVFVAQVLPRCWSVESVSPFPYHRPVGVGISVRGRRAEVAFRPRGASTVTVEVGYGGQSEVVTKGVDGEVRLDLPFDTDTTGHFLILFRDVTGAVISASGGPLPPGDFAAG